MKIAVYAFLCASIVAAQNPDQGRRELLGMMVNFRTALRNPNASVEARQKAEALMTEGMPFLRAGKTGEVRRRMSHGLAILRGQPWNARSEYAASLVLRTPTAIFDPVRPVLFEFSQIYPCDYSFQAEPVLRASLARPTGQKIRELGTQTGLSRDLIDEPFLFEADLKGTPDGRYLLRAELLDGDAIVASVVADVSAATDLEKLREKAEQQIAVTAGLDNLKASIRYPFDLARLINTGRRDLSRGMNFSAELARSKELLAALSAGKDPLRQAKGEVKKHYVLKEAGEILPYRLYVPSAYDGSREFPLIVSLHGLGGNEDTMLSRDGGLLKDLAEKHGYIVVTPLGYRPNGGYGRMNTGSGFSLPGRQRITELSEKDVMRVLELVREEYRIDARNIFLTGHSMGGGGTWMLGAKYADLWAALAPVAPGVTPTDGMALERLKDKPILICHGAKDLTAPPEASRAMAAKLRELGGHPQHVELPDADHGTIVAAVLPKIIAFFDEHRRSKN